MKNLLIVSLVSCIAWFGSAIIRLENERYALSIGMCQTDTGVADPVCLADVETRTSFLWHLAYGLRLL